MVKSQLGALYLEEQDDLVFIGIFCNIGWGVGPCRQQAPPYVWELHTRERHLAEQS